MKRMRRPVRVFVAAIAVLLVFLTGCSTLTVTEQSVTVEAGTSFDPRTLVKDLPEARWEDLRVAGNVNTQVPGEYEVELSLNGKRGQTVSITVVDTTAPLFKVKPAIEVYEGASLTAEELVDLSSVQDVQPITWSLDLNGADLNTAGAYTVYVIASDPSGNESRQSVDLAVKVYDVAAPEIAGAEATGVYIGSEFDPMKGVTVTDDLDVAPTLTVDVSGLDLTKQGRYVITYTAKDASGNEAILERVIQVGEAGNFIYTTAGGATWNATGRSPHPYLVAVNRSACTITIYGKDGNGNYTVPVKAMACSVGREGHETKAGEYKTGERFEWCYMVDGTWGRYAIRIYKGLMFHSVPYYTKAVDDLEWEEFNKLGEPASLGCVRLCMEDIMWLYENCEYSFSAVVYDDTVEAGPLGKPESVRIDGSYENARGWDPTDPAPENPWHAILTE